MLLNWRFWVPFLIVSLHCGEQMSRPRIFAARALTRRQMHDFPPHTVQNQSGSILYNYLLGGTDISLASPICNSLALVFTGLTARALGERQPWNLRTALGMVLIVGGVGMCVVAKADTEAIKQVSVAAG